jgi:hypothetical protein
MWEHPRMPVAALIHIMMPADLAGLRRWTRSSQVPAILAQLAPDPAGGHRRRRRYRGCETGRGFAADRVDEKSEVQALKRTQPIRRVGPTGSSYAPKAAAGTGQPRSLPDGKSLQITSPISSPTHRNQLFLTVRRFTAATSQASRISPPRSSVLPELEQALPALSQIKPTTGSAKLDHQTNSATEH